MMHRHHDPRHEYNESRKRVEGELLLCRRQDSGVDTCRGLRVLQHVVIGRLCGKSGFDGAIETATDDRGFD